MPMETIGVWPGTITLAEYDALGEDIRIEVVDGVPVVSPQPSIRHQWACRNLMVLLGEAAPSDLIAVGPVDWVLDEIPLTVRAPDVAVIERAPLGERRLTTPPILAVEVLSPDSHERDLVTKRREYAATGLTHYWVVAPDTPQIVVYRRTDTGTLHETTRATGDDTLTLTLTEPFPLTLRPSDLLR